MKTRLLVVDDHPLFRSGVRNALLETGDYERIEEAGSTEEARRSLAASSFDLVVVDLALPDGSGFDLLDQHARLVGAPHFFVLSMSADRSVARKAMRLGASGYAPKGIGLTTLTLGLRLVAAGEIYIEGEILRDILTSQTAEPRDKAGQRSLIEALSPRERDALDALLEGLTTKEMAAKLGVSHRTAENYQSAVYAALGIQSPIALVKLAFRAGIMDFS